MATTKNPHSRLCHPLIIEGLKGKTSNNPSDPRTRRTATSVRGVISSIATLIKRNDAPQRAASMKRTRYSFSFIANLLL
jgi:hypothetical protein